MALRQVRSRNTPKELVVEDDGATVLSTTRDTRKRANRAKVFCFWVPSDLMMKLYASPRCASKSTLCPKTFVASALAQRNSARL